MGVNWTEEQKQVISARGSNILVSAAAGSGKTAVLVERIITRLLEDASPLNVDQLLIVTFTEAAASEMKERIRDAIERKLMEDPENVHLQRQATLIHYAKITTIHSFCLSVIRDYFHVIDLDPGFRVAEEGELELLKQDVMKELLEESYSSGEERFLRFVECFATGKDDRKLEEVILNLYEYARSYPDPKQWLTSCVDTYYVDTMEELEKTSLASMLRVRVGEYVKDVQSLLHGALLLCEDEEGLEKCKDVLESDVIQVEKLRQAQSLAEVSARIRQFVFKRMPSIKRAEHGNDVLDQVKELREQAKQVISELKKYYFFADLEVQLQDMNHAAPVVEELVSLVEAFSDRLREKKRVGNMIDFGDMEQYALEILKNDHVMREYQEQFEEIMIDEYQDSNLIQEAILTRISRIGQGVYNIFMVGDVKQSIYRFRLSRPELFMQKFDTYSKGEGLQRRIDLHKNFRSRTEVLESVNYLFYQLMGRKLGGIAYDKDAALYPGADYTACPGQETEVLLVDPGQVTDTQALEARAVAKRIKTLLKEGKVQDKQTKTMRPVRCSDIVILLRSLRGWSDTFAKVLGEEGIPVYTGTKEGYFQTREISLLLDYLKVLNNERQDIPLTAVLTSVFGNMTAEELAAIRGAYPKQPFHEAVATLAKETESDKELRAIREKAVCCLNRMERYRSMVPYTAIHDLLWKIMKETGYMDYMSALPGGAQRKANLEMLLDKARAFAGTSYKGLSHFVRYIDQLQRYQIDYGEANLADEQADVVRIMSIHKSKGLEFPVVFVSGMGKKFNTQDVTGTVIVHPTLGIGVHFIDLEDRTKVTTLPRTVMQKEAALENAGEELRVLYVALTRAKEKLILTGCYSGKKENRWILEGETENQVTLPFYLLAGARSYLDWLMPALLRMESASFQKAIGGDSQGPPIQIVYWDESELRFEDLAQAAGNELAKDVLLHWDGEKTFAQTEKERLEEMFSYTYPYEEVRNRKLKFSVSDLKKMAYESETEEETGEVLFPKTEEFFVPEFIKEKTVLQGAGRGTAYHKVLELLDFEQTDTYEKLEEAIARMEASHHLDAQMSKAVRISDIWKFLQSDCGRRMQQAARNHMLRKEQPFVLGVQSGQIYGDDSKEILVVQGIIDVCFEEDGSFVVVDYKTDRVRSMNELQERYHAQLEYYAQALAQVLQKPVKEKIIYSFALHEERSI